MRNEYTQMSQLLNDSTAKDIINSMYNHVDAGNYGKISFNQFEALVTRILPSAMNSTGHLQNIFEVFTGMQSTPTQGDKTAGASHADKLQFRKSNLK